MKTLLKNILVLAVMLGTFTSYASATLNGLPTFNNPNEGDYISVSNAKGKVVFSGRIHHNGDIKVLFDFTQLPDGIYTVEINKDFEIQFNSMEVKNNVVTPIENTTSTIFKPVVRTTKDSKVLISKLALNDENMAVELYFEDNLIHKEIVAGKDILNRVYKLDSTAEGHYKVIIRSNDRVFTENFEI